jgi:MFS transporter, LPLT family, lysophospholipid transporter
VTRGFTPLMGAQFLSALADNAVLVIAIALLMRTDAPGWMTPMLKFVFIGSYVVFAIGVGAVADAMPKARVMLITNAVKGAGCLLLLAGVHPLAAYALIGLGAAAYSPAKYGLLTELLPAERLVAANAWLEGLTIASVILGTVVGGMLISPEFAAAIGRPAGSGAALGSAVAAAFALYLGAALVNLLIPDSGRRYARHSARVVDLFHAFARSLQVLVADDRGRVSLLTTSLLWGAGATLQLVVIDWGRVVLGLPLDRAAMLPGVVAVGVALGAAVAARTVALDRAFSILPLGVLFGPLIVALVPVASLPLVCLLLFLNGIAAGFFIVPMNAMLQHRGVVLTNAGQAIAVQNFCENLSVMAMVGAYALLLGSGVPLVPIVIAMAAFVSLAMLAVQWHRVERVGGRVKRDALTR